ncbi:hypothetical protein bAD24_III10695 [Burkholderia sp. AD24]|nr:hypothetical protein bAD24_III10695 [Burkholderia sp. AD24]
MVEGQKRSRSLLCIDVPNAEIDNHFFYPCRQGLESLGGRVNKLRILLFALNLSTVHEAKQVWRLSRKPDVSGR